MVLCVPRVPRTASHPLHRLQSPLLPHSAPHWSPTASRLTPPILQHKRSTLGQVLILPSGPDSEFSPHSNSPGWWEGSKRVHWLHFREEPPCVTQDQQRWGGGGVTRGSDSAWTQVTKQPQAGLSCGRLVAQWCLILFDPLDCSLSVSSVRGIFQPRMLEWVAISFSSSS